MRLASIVQWVKNEKWEEILERRNAEGGSLQAEVFQKVTEVVVNERMSQCEKAKGIEEKKKVKGWSTEEMKNKPTNDREEDTEEMIECTSMSQEEREMNVGRSLLGKIKGRGAGQVQGGG